MEFQVAQPQRLRWYLCDLPTEFDSLIIVPTGDVHYGSPYFSLKHYSRHLAFIADNLNVYTVLMGDLIESSIKTSKGDIYRQVGTPQDQRDWQIEQLLPIKDKILGSVIGNHEERVYKEVGIDISADIAAALGVPYRAEGVMLKVCFGSRVAEHKERKWTFFGYCTHGYGGARTAAAKAVKVERTSTYIHSDFYIMSHDHVVNAANAVYLMPDERAYLDAKTGFKMGKVTAHTKKLLKSNSFLMWGGYAEIGGFPPTSLETPFVRLSGSGEKKIVRIES